MSFLTINPIWIHLTWAIIVVVMLIVEYNTEDFTSIWFAIGGVVALIMSLCGVESIMLQIGVFLAVSLILLLSLRNVLKRTLIKQTIATNKDALIGQKIQILKDADSFNPGEGKINGLIWTILCEENDEVKKDDIAIVTRIEGNKLIVKKQ